MSICGDCCKKSNINDEKEIDLTEQNNEYIQLDIGEKDLKFYVHKDIIECIEDIFEKENYFTLDDKSKTSEGIFYIRAKKAGDQYSNVNFQQFASVCFCYKYDNDKFATEKKKLKSNGNLLNLITKINNFKNVFFDDLQKKNQGNMTQNQVNIDKQYNLRNNNNLNNNIIQNQQNITTGNIQNINQNNNNNNIIQPNQNLNNKQNIKNEENFEEISTSIINKNNNQDNIDNNQNDIMAETCIVKYNFIQDNCKRVIFGENRDPDVYFSEEAIEFCDGDINNLFNRNKKNYLIATYNPKKNAIYIHYNESIFKEDDESKIYFAENNGKIILEFKNTIQSFCYDFRKKNDLIENLKKYHERIKKKKNNIVIIDSVKNCYMGFPIYKTNEISHINNVTNIEYNFDEEYKKFTKDDPDVFSRMKFYIKYKDKNIDCTRKIFFDDNFFENEEDIKNIEQKLKYLKNFTDKNGNIFFKNDIDKQADFKINFSKTTNGGTMMHWNYKEQYIKDLEIMYTSGNDFGMDKILEQEFKRRKKQPDNQLVKEIIDLVKSKTDTEQSEIMVNSFVKNKTQKQKKSSYMALKAKIKNKTTEKIGCRYMKLCDDQGYYSKKTTGQCEDIRDFLENSNGIIKNNNISNLLIDAIDETDQKWTIEIPLDIILSEYFLQKNLPDIISLHKNNPIGAFEGLFEANIEGYGNSQREAVINEQKHTVKFLSGQFKKYDNVFQTIRDYVRDGTLVLGKENNIKKLFFNPKNVEEKLINYIPYIKENLQKHHYNDYVIEMAVCNLCCIVYNFLIYYNSNECVYNKKNQKKINNNNEEKITSKEDINKGNKVGLQIK